MSVYLIHFEQPYKHARHYLGYAQDVAARLQRHRAGTGARLMEVITQAGIPWHVAKIWPDGTPELERALKLWHSGVRLCPTCRQERLYNRTLSQSQRSRSR
jgi:predicted GIY-YIG superfamily endonuclease